MLEHHHHHAIFLTFATSHAVQTLGIYFNVMLMQLSTSLAWTHQKKVPGKALQFHDCPEALLILYRSGIFTIDTVTDSLNLKICQNHREYFGTRWRRSNARCIYPEHNNRKGRTDRGASPSLCKEYYLKTRQTIPVGSGKLNT